MGKSGNNIAEHVRSAKMWLEKAEQSFDRQSEIQGELNLMLAEAEMKNLRKRHGLKMRAKLRVAAAMGIAVMAAGLCMLQPGKVLRRRCRYGTPYRQCSSLLRDCRLHRPRRRSLNHMQNGRLRQSLPPRRGRQPRMNNAMTQRRLLRHQKLPRRFNAARLRRKRC